MDIYYVGDRFVSEQVAKIPVTDLSVIRGYGVFDFLRTYNGIPFHLRDHIVRLENSARLINLSLPRCMSEIEDLVLEGLSRSSHDEKSIRIVVTGGPSQDGISPDNLSLLLLMITAVRSFSTSSYDSGKKLITNHVERFMPGAKTINYIPAILSMQKARDQGAIEALYVDRDGYIQEGTTSNFFAVRCGTIITPPCQRILPGITRNVVLQLVEGEHIVIEERPIHGDEFSLFDETFITSSVKEVLPITQIDSLKIGHGNVGPTTRKIMELFRSYTREYQPSEKR